MPRAPHILLITDDQHRGDCLGLAGHPVLSTPNLDQLGRLGAHFTRCYSEVPSCIAARRILISGQHQAHCGLVGYRDELDWEPPQTLPGELAKAGYQTQLVGKLHLWPRRKRYGFQEMTWSDGYNPGDDDYSRFLRANGVQDPWALKAHGVDVNGWVGRPWHLAERLTHTSWCASEAVRFLTERDPSCPFFLHLSMVDPHPPLTPPALYYERYLHEELPPPVIGDWCGDPPDPLGQAIAGARVNLTGAALQRCRAAYYGMINHVDDQVGRVMEALARLRLLNDTVIVFSSDHGEMLGDHYRFRKSLLYEGSARVPLLIRTPRWMECQAGLTSALPVGWQDLLPTLLDCAGVPIPATVDGRSLLPVLRGETPPWREAIHLEHTAGGPGGGSQGLCDGHEKYLWWCASGREQLFDLDADPTECHDLVDARPERTAHWRARLVAALRDRPEGFVEDDRLVPGRPYQTIVPGHEPAP